MIVALDPGHGGSDPGAEVAGIREATANLELAFLTASALRSRGLGVYLTRTGDETTSIEARVAGAARARAGILLSLHHNSHVSPEARGTEVLYYPGFGPSAGLARVVHRETQTLPTEDRGLIPRPNLRLLRLASERGLPSCLVEVAFLTNVWDRQLVQDPAFRREAAGALARGAARYAGVSPASILALEILGLLSYAGLLAVLGRGSSERLALTVRP